MKFGAVAVREALGTVLAHSAQAADPVCPESLVYKIPKGTVLSAQHLADLAQNGVERVTVARLEPLDVSENDAAARIAEALVAANCELSVSNAATGRVNVRADAAGIVEMDCAAITAANCIHPGITIATVPQYHRLTARGMATTIKIIPYAVPEADVVKVCELVRAAMSLRAPVLASASLIETEIDMSRARSDKGRLAIKGRLDAFAVQMSPRCVVAHAEEDIARALREAPGALVLILTGSATSDIEDTAPAALRRAGGSVIHYGMPVDPGNLLFIGTLGAKTVIGLPGCARSPALNGADWVLERVICGLPVGPAEIMGMGVGGLLKEIPSRPVPRGNIEQGSE